MTNFTSYPPHLHHHHYRDLNADPSIPVSVPVPVPVAHATLSHFLYLTSINPAYQPDSTLSASGPQWSSSRGNPNLTLHHLERVGKALAGEYVGVDYWGGEGEVGPEWRAKKRKRDDEDELKLHVDSEPLGRRNRLDVDAAGTDGDGEGELGKEDVEDQDVVGHRHNKRRKMAAVGSEDGDDGWQDREDFELAQDDDDVDLHNSDRDPAGAVGIQSTVGDKEEEEEEEDEEEEEEEEDDDDDDEDEEEQEQGRRRVDLSQSTADKTEFSNPKPRKPQAGTADQTKAPRFTSTKQPPGEDRTTNGGVKESKDRGKTKDKVKDERDRKSLDKPERKLPGDETKKEKEKTKEKLRKHEKPQEKDISLTKMAEAGRDDDERGRLQSHHHHHHHHHHHRHPVTKAGYDGQEVRPAEEKSRKKKKRKKSTVDG